jgi:hypothetical protein
MKLELSPPPNVNKEEIAETTEGTTADNEESAKPPAPPAPLRKSKSVIINKPFQRLQFLVRDWQNFDNEFEEDVSFEILQHARDDMQSYVQEVLRTRNLSDLQSTREQITRCFDTLDCFLLPHPGIFFITFFYVSFF